MIDPVDINKIRQGLATKKELKLLSDQVSSGTGGAGTGGNAAESMPVVLTAAQLAILAAASDPLNASIGSAATLPVGGSAVSAGRMLAINCTVAGNVTIMLSGGTLHTFPVVAGYTVLPYAVTQVTTSTATAVFSNMS